MLNSVKHASLFSIKKNTITAQLSLLSRFKAKLIDHSYEIYLVLATQMFKIIKRSSLFTTQIVYSINITGQA